MLPSYDFVIPADEVVELGRACASAPSTTPGHTPGSMSFLLEGHPVVFSGDTLFPGGAGNTSFPGGDFEHDHRVDRPQAVHAPGRHHRDAGPRPRHHHRRGASAPAGVGGPGMVSSGGTCGCDPWCGAPHSGVGDEDGEHGTGPTLRGNDDCWCGSGKKYKRCHRLQLLAPGTVGPRRPVPDAHRAARLRRDRLTGPAHRVDGEVARRHRADAHRVPDRARRAGGDGRRGRARRHHRRARSRRRTTRTSPATCTRARSATTASRSRCARR